MTTTIIKFSDYAGLADITTDPDWSDGGTIADDGDAPLALPAVSAGGALQKGRAIIADGFPPVKNTVRLHIVAIAPFNKPFPADETRIILPIVETNEGAPIADHSYAYVAFVNASGVQEIRCRMVDQPTTGGTKETLIAYNELSESLQSVTFTIEVGKKLLRMWVDVGNVVHDIMPISAVDVGAPWTRRTPDLTAFLPELQPDRWGIANRGGFLPIEIYGVVLIDGIEEYEQDCDRLPTVVSNQATVDDPLDPILDPPGEDPPETIVDNSRVVTCRYTVSQHRRRDHQSFALYTGGTIGGLNVADHIQHRVDPMQTLLLVPQAKVGSDEQDSTLIAGVLERLVAGPESDGVNLHFVRDMELRSRFDLVSDQSFIGSQDELVAVNQSVDWAEYFGSSNVAAEGPNALTTLNAGSPETRIIKYFESTGASKSAYFDVDNAVHTDLHHGWGLLLTTTAKQFENPEYDNYTVDVNIATLEGEIGDGKWYSGHIIFRAKAGSHEYYSAGWERSVTDTPPPTFRITIRRWYTDTSGNPASDIVATSGDLGKSISFTLPRVLRLVVDGNVVSISWDLILDTFVSTVSATLDDHVSSDHKYIGVGFTRSRNAGSWSAEESVSFKDLVLTSRPADVGIGSGRSDLLFGGEFALDPRFALEGSAFSEQYQTFITNSGGRTGRLSYSTEPIAVWAWQTMATDDWARLLARVASMTGGARPIWMMVPDTAESKPCFLTDVRTSQKAPSQTQTQFTQILQNTHHREAVD